MLARRYTWLLYVLLPLVPLRLAWRAWRQPEYLRHIPERFGFFEAKPGQRTLWVHAVSVGETRAAAPLIKLLRACYPDHRILLTAMTPTGRAAAQELFGALVSYCYLPYDYPFAVRRFLQHFQPQLGLVLETEIWPNLIHACAEARVPLLLVNARLSEKSLRRYRRFPRLTRAALGGLTKIAAQTRADADRLGALGAESVCVCGNLKFDVDPPAAQMALGLVLRERFGRSRPVWLAASTRDGEEAMLLESLPAIDVTDALMILVPRHPQRFAEVAALLQTKGIRFQRRSENQPIAAQTQVVLGDSMGEMFAYYSAADAALVGGSLKPFGGQNLIEACAIGIPVLLGPHTFNFAEASELAVKEGAALRVRDAQELVQQLNRLLRDDRARRAMAEAGLRFTAAHRGASQRVAALVADVLSSCPAR
jgi:3-deoxy-D-manno-octulosonic-acid transferase